MFITVKDHMVDTRKIVSCQTEGLGRIVKITFEDGSTEDTYFEYISDAKEFVKRVTDIKNSEESETPEIAAMKKEIDKLRAEISELRGERRLDEGYFAIPKKTIMEMKSQLSEIHEFLEQLKVKEGD